MNPPEPSPCISTPASFGETRAVRPSSRWLAPWLLLGLVGLLRVAGFADELDRWTFRNPNPFGSQVQTVVQGNGWWLVLANASMLATSPDGVSWDLSNVGTNGILSGGAFGNGRFVVGSSRGLFVSADAHTWTFVSIGSIFNDVTFGSGLFLGVGNANTVWRSANGTNWNSLAVGGATAGFARAQAASGRFFLTGTESGTQVLYTSADATNWTGPVNLGTNGLQRIAGTNGLYVGLNPMINVSGSWTEIRTSTNGSAWAAPIFMTNHYVSDLVYSQGQFVAIDQYQRALLSTNGTAWTELSAPELWAANRMVTDGHSFLASGLSGRIVTSPDGTNWVRRTLGPQNSLAAGVHAGGLYVAVGGSVLPGGNDPYSVSTVAISTNGRSWVEQSPGTTNSLTAVTWGNGRFVAVGTNGAIVTSLDGTNWAAAGSPTSDGLSGVAYGAGQFVAVGGPAAHATILNSPDGLTWTLQSGTAPIPQLYAVGFGANRFVAVGQTNGTKAATILTSTDGLSWTPQVSMITNYALRGITYGNGTYAAVGDHSVITVSPDAGAWTNISLVSVVGWRGVAYGNGWFVAPGSASALCVSSNGLNWSTRTALNVVSLQPCYAVVAGDDSFLLLGYEGQVLESAAFHPAALQVVLGLRAGAPSVLSLTAPEERAYELQYTDVLPAVWQSLGIFTNHSAATQIPVTASPQGRRFYQAIKRN